MTWLPEVADGEAPLDQVFGLRPAAYERFREMYARLWTSGLDADTLDICRDRIESLLRCEPDPAPARFLSDAQWAAHAYAEQYVLDPHGLSDRDFERLRPYFDDAQIATLTLAVAMFDAQARFAVALEV
jgi:alkylhydroperoxidase family enzyme